MAACAYRSAAVHPRACGEHDQDLGLPVADLGSSPRMRGTPALRHTNKPLYRFIPAHAGNTRSSRPVSTPRPVHPRACGEHVLMPDEDDWEDGSSPRMRGTRAAASATAASRTVHPRACGEHARPLPVGEQPAGSSPRMRGTRFSPQPLFSISRFIPAHAGNTSLSLPPEIPSTVHPRACGEHRLRAFGTCSVTGSSPRMRGTHLRGNFRRQAARFIPAHAGNTVANGPARSGSSVHPRACGEHIGNLETMREMGGSSPRMRGTPM